MVDKARERFAREIREGRLTLLNVGIGAGSGNANFWISEQPEWSSFDKAIASRDGAAHTLTAVPVVPFPDLLAEHGVPHYLKIDIEGNDRLCVEPLQGATLPTYISVEAECVGDGEVLSDEQATEMLRLLRDVGYRRFKLLDQQGWTPVRPKPRRLLNRVVTSAARGRLQLPGLANLAEKLTDSARLAALGFRFDHGSSGPWGDDIPGGWMNFETARSTYLRERSAHFSQERALYSFWCDWHATF
jgi:FkbM family methyltransferase